MTNKRDYYEVLGVTRQAGQDEIKQAYRTLARQYHPDVAKNKTDAERHFKEINEAFAVLSNPEKREQYDRFGHAGVDLSGGFDFSVGFDMFDDLLGSFFGESRGSAGSNRGADLRVDVEISLEDAYKGVEREISVYAATACGDCKGIGAKKGGTQACSACRGQGRVREIQQSFFGRVIRTVACRQCQGQGQILKDPCKTCRGNGVVETQRTVKAQIPRGLDSGNRIRITGEGEAGYRGAGAGDLYVFVHVRPHPKFKRDGQTVYYESSISFPEAALGNEIEIPTLTGKEKLDIPPGTANGAAFRLKGKGMPTLNGYSHGDQIVIIRVEVPKKLTEQQKRLLLDLAQSLGIKLTPLKGFLGRVKDALG